MRKPSITEILSDDGVGFDMSHLPQEYSDRGTLIHRVAECHVKGLRLPKVPDKWKGFGEALAKYFCDTELETWEAEPELEHDLLGIQGHPDWFGIADMEMSVRDYKTGSIPLYAGPQLSGYELLLRRKYPGLKVMDHTVIKLMENGRYSLKTFNLREKAENMRLFLEAYHGFFERRGVKWTHRT